MYIYECKVSHNVKKNKGGLDDLQISTCNKNHSEFVKYPVYNTCTSFFFMHELISQGTKKKETKEYCNKLIFFH